MSDDPKPLSASAVAEVVETVVDMIRSRRAETKPPQEPPSAAFIGSLVVRELMKFVMSMAAKGQEVRAITLAPAAYRRIEASVRERDLRYPPATYEGMIAEREHPYVPALAQLVIYTPAGPVTILRGEE